MIRTGNKNIKSSIFLGPEGTDNASYAEQKHAAFAGQALASKHNAR
jgi:hypothetical protein